MWDLIVSVPDYCLSFYFRSGQRISLNCIHTLKLCSLTWPYTKVSSFSVKFFFSLYGVTLVLFIVLFFYHRLSDIRLHWICDEFRVNKHPSRHCCRQMYGDRENILLAEQNITAESLHVTRVDLDIFYVVGNWAAKRMGTLYFRRDRYFMHIRLSDEEYKQSVLRDCNIYRSFHYPRNSDISFILSNLQSRSESTTRIRSHDTLIRRGADTVTRTKSENGNEKRTKNCQGLVDNYSCILHFMVSICHHCTNRHVW